MALQAAALPVTVETEFAFPGDTFPIPNFSTGQFPDGVCWGIASYAKWYRFGHGPGLHQHYSEQSAKRVGEAAFAAVRDLVHSTLSSIETLIGQGLLEAATGLGQQRDTLILSMLLTNRPHLLGMWRPREEHLLAGHAVLVVGYRAPNFIIYDVNDVSQTHPIACGPTGNLLPYTNSAGTFGFLLQMNALGFSEAYLSPSFQEIYEQNQPDGGGEVTDYEFLTAWGSEGAGQGQFQWPHGIAIAQNGNVLVADSGNFRIQEFTSNGLFLDEWGEQGSGQGQFGEIGQLVMDRNGNIYVADAGNYRIQKFTRDGSFLTEWGSPGTGDGEFCEIEGPSDIAVDSLGHVYVADGRNGRIQKFAGDGTFLTKWGSPGFGDGEFGGVQGMVSSVAVGPDDYVYAADARLRQDGTYMSPRVQKFTTAGAFVSSWVHDGDGEWWDIACDITGYLYAVQAPDFAGLSPGQVLKFASDGQLVTQWGLEDGAGSSADWMPSSLAVDNAGNVYVVDSFAPQVVKFQPVYGTP